jgi:hypothetical protein
MSSDRVLIVLIAVSHVRLQLLARLEHAKKHGALTRVAIHSSRTRFAGRLNSGDRAHMDFGAYKPQLITGAHVVLLFTIVAAFHGFKVAVLFALAGALGYLNAFAAFRSLLAILGKRHVSRLIAVIVALTALAVSR